MQAMQAAPVLPKHLQIELERRPRAARKLGLVVPPPQKSSALPPVVINEDSLQSHAMEISRRPVAAKRLGLVEQYVDSLLDEETIIVSEKSVASLAAGAEEIHRRPHAADRLNLGPPKLPAVVSAPVRPLHATWSYVEEVDRQPRAARRQGLVALNPPLGDRLPSPLPLAKTTSAALEAQRRPRSLTRVFPDRTRLPAQDIPDLPTRATAFFEQEAARRPRAAARLAAMEAAHSSPGPSSTWPSTHPELLEGDLQYVDFQKANLSPEVAPALSKQPMGAAEPNPFTALERMLEERLTAAQASGDAGGYSLGAMGEGRVRGGVRGSRGGSRGGSRHGPGSRGGSLRDGAGYSSTLKSGNGSMSRKGSMSSLSRCGSQVDVKQTAAKMGGVVGAGMDSAASAHPAPVGVHCGVEADGVVVCRDEHNNVVVLTCEADELTGAMTCTTADNQKFKA